MDLRRRGSLFAAAVALAAIGACHHASGGGTTDASGGGSDATPAIDAPTASVCGTRTGMRGKTSRRIHVAGADRTYIVYLPQAVDPGTPIPLVMVFHGYTMSGDDMYGVTGYPALADSEHIALAFPDGEAGPNSSGAPWNVGANVCPADFVSPPDASGDDFALMDAIQADIANDQCIDTGHVFATGFSMGGYFSHHIGCMKSGVRAVAPHSGGTHTLDACTNGHVPIIIFHGTGDPLVPDGCDDPNATLGVPNVTPSATAWAAHNGCSTTTTTVQVDGGSCEVWNGCPVDGQVELCTFTLMGHCWAGGEGNLLFGCPTYASATQLEWDFFKTHAW